MPVAQSQGHAGKALAIAAVAILLIAVVAVFVVVARRAEATSRSTSATIASTPVRPIGLAAEIDDGGGCRPLPGPVGTTVISSWST